MNMNIKIRNKIAAVLLLSVAVLGGGGFILYTQHVGMVKQRRGFYAGAEAATEVIAVPRAQGSAAAGGKNTRTLDGQLPRVEGVPEAEVATGAGRSAYSARPTGISTGSARGYKNSAAEAALYHGSGGRSLLMASGGGRRSGAGQVYSAAGGAGSISAESGPAAFVPFKNNNAGNYALVDPGTDAHMQKITPVGGGFWILMLLAVAYAGLRKFRVK